VTTLLSPESNEMTGTLHDLELRALHDVDSEAGAGSLQTIDPMGECITMADIALDTTAPLGKACADHDECGTGKICDVASQSCAASQCSAAPGPCADGRQCYRYDYSESLYCAQACGVFAPCAATYSCESGICKHTGTAAAGELCSRHRDTTAACASGLFCNRDATSTTCISECNPFAIDPGCASSQRCLFESYTGACNAALASSATSPAALDQPCSIPPPQGGNPPYDSVPCADDGRVYRGLCYVETGFGTQSMCRRVCDPLGPSCPNGQACLPGAGSQWGVSYVCR
jgi:hypothetical protein